MRNLTMKEVEDVYGGIRFNTPVGQALGDTAAYGPLGVAYAAGYQIGTWMYNNWSSINQSLQSGLNGIGSGGFGYPAFNGGSFDAMTGAAPPVGSD